MFQQYLEPQSLLRQIQADSLPAPLFDQLHPEWQKELERQKNLIERIDTFVRGREIAPSYDLVFRALAQPIDSTRVVVFGQDPYPTLGHAHGLAFSVESSVSPLPPSLRNIYKELHSDLAIERANGDLSDWAEQGVMLINRILSTDVGQSMAHSKLGWQKVTETVAQTLGKKGVVAVLWGNTAHELKQYFRPEDVVSSVHPSPLSAHRGFFGSSPFSKVNAKLVAKGLKQIDW
jgi:uracil-DNA glycosylase